VIALENGPEALLDRVAVGDFGELKWPILVAARSRLQYEEFVYKNGLLCCEVRRFFGRAEFFAGSDPGKILLLLPDCQDDAATGELVRWWVEDEDRYTVQIDTISPWLMGRAQVCWQAGGAVMAALLLALLWLVMR